MASKISKHSPSLALSPKIFAQYTFRRIAFSLEPNGIHSNFHFCRMALDWFRTSSNIFGAQFSKILYRLQYLTGKQNCYQQDANNLFSLQFIVSNSFYAESVNEVLMIPSFQFNLKALNVSSLLKCILIMKKCISAFSRRIDIVWIGFYSISYIAKAPH